MMGPHIARLSLFALQIFQLISLAAAGAVYLQLQLSHRRHLLPHPFRYLSRERRFCDFAKIVMLVLGIVHVNVVQARSCYGNFCSNSSDSGQNTYSFPTFSIVFPIVFATCVAAISAFACYVRTRRRRSLVIGMRERGRQLSEQRQLEADLTSSAGFLPPYIAAPPRNIHSKTPALQAHQSRATANDLESGLQNSTHHGVSNEGVRPSVHDPLLRDQGRSRSPSTFPAPAPVPEPTAPPQTYQSAKSSPPPYTPHQEASS